MNSDDKTPLPPDPERTEPKAVVATLPIWFFVLLGLLFFWGQMYLDRNAGGFRAEVYEPYPSLTFVQALQPRTEGGAMIAKGKTIYANNCQPCHQPTGMGAPGVAPPLAGSEWVTAGSERMIRIIMHGLTGPIQVKGTEWNLVMLPFGHLSDEDIAAVSTFVRQEWGNKAPPVTPDQVQAVRDQTKDRAQNWTAAELLQIPAGE
jgi:mono/diheme cytochrome c family protein